MGKYVIWVLCLLIIVAGVFWFISADRVDDRQALKAPAPEAKKKRVEIPQDKVIDFGKLKSEGHQELNALMEERKAPYGVDKSIDMVVKSDESIRVGDRTVRMEKILQDLKLQRGEILEGDMETGSIAADGNDYGVRVVQPGDNIWNIHFQLLKDYYNHKGIQLSPLADEPDRRGRSSGVGKILKFSENMVHIYNMRDKRLETNLDQIYPLSKVVIYNMTHIFALLDRIDYEAVHRIEFDGDTLWLPAEQ
jgi:hypothetical protein